MNFYNGINHPSHLDANFATLHRILWNFFFFLNLVRKKQKEGTKTLRDILGRFYLD